MNDITELVSHGISNTTAELMLADYKKRIGTRNGIYEIVDINYDFEKHAKDVTLKCSECGIIIHRTMMQGRNKWSELIKTCKECGKRKQKADFEKSEKRKKDELLSYIGKPCGDYLVTNVEVGTPNKLVMKCQICGYEIKIAYPHFKTGIWTDNKCHKHYQKIKYVRSYIGKRYWRLTVIDVLEKGVRKFKCRCDCGNIYFAVPYNLENGSEKSCGCLQREISENAFSHDRLYSVWQNMKRRCYSPNNRNYHNYGGRGIVICDEWKNNYIAFKDWAYSSGYNEKAEFGECTIDRIDVNGNYEPKNCRWITNIEQQKNKRPPSELKKKKKKRSSLIFFNGEFIPKYDLCHNFGISVEAFNYRVNKKGMTIEDALNTPKLIQGRPKKEPISD